MRLAGCAVISSTTVVMHPTRHLTQAALDHLESIIDDPYHPGENGLNGAGEDDESEGDGWH